MPTSFFVLAHLPFFCALQQAEAISAADTVRVLPHAELSAELAAIAERHPEVATLHRIGSSREGRDLEALRLTAAEDPSACPAILLIANLEGPRVFESGVVLHHAARLADGYGTDEAARALLASTVVWCLPRANPDAAEGRFASPRFERWSTAGGVDDDRDGRVGEDAPEDLNGDGLITSMRVEDPQGNWIEDPAEPRLLIEADPAKGERGRWKLYPEARDRDGDERYGEDAPGDTRVDRNFASGWEAHTAEGGLFPTDQPEARALCDFVIAQKNLILVAAYDGLDNLVAKPDRVDDDAPPVKRVPKEGVLASDAALLDELGRRYREQTGSEIEGSREDAGTFTRWCYDHRGLTTLELTLWQVPDAPVDTDEESAEGGEEPGRRKKGELSADARALAWIDAAEESWRFVDWAPYEHPELGRVEIGGLAPYARIEPPRSSWTEIAEDHYAWFVGLGALLPRISISECKREEIGAGLWKVTAVVQNDAYLPLQSRSARRTRTLRPARVRLQLPEAATLVAGEAQELLSDLPGSGGRAEYEWLVHGPPGMQIDVSVDTDHAGVVAQRAEVTQ